MARMIINLETIVSDTKIELLTRERDVYQQQVEILVNRMEAAIEALGDPEAHGGLEQATLEAVQMLKGHHRGNVRIDEGEMLD